MANIASLIVEVKNKGIEATKRALKGLSSESKKTEKATDGLTKSVKNLAGAYLGIGTAVAGFRKFIDVNRQFQVLQSTLKVATGSADAAAMKFKELNQFAANTPFQLTEVTEAFIKLKNFGLDPSEKALTSYGNTVSALGKPLEQMVEAVADAVTGEFERLKEFGIKTRKEGENIKFTFAGVTTQIGNNAKEIQDYLISLGETNFSGAMADRMKTLDGAISNLQQNWTNLWANDEAVKSTTNSVNDLAETLKDPAVVDGFQALGTAFAWLAGVGASAAGILGNINDEIARLGAGMTKEDWNFYKNRIANSGLIDRSGGVSDSPADAMARAREQYGIQSVNSGGITGGNEIDKSIAKTTDLIFEYTTGLEKVRMEYAKNRDEILKSVGTDKEKSEALKLLDDRFNKQREELYLQSDAYLQLKDDAVAFFEAQEEAAEQAEEKMRQYGENVKGVFQGIFQTMNSGGSIGDFLKNRLMGNIADMASSQASSLFTSKVDSGSLLGKIGGLFFDNGGYIPSGSAGIVGERGPEIVRGPANVTSRKDTAKQIGNTFNISLPGVTNKKDAFEARGQIERTIAMAVNKAGRYA